MSKEPKQSGSKDIMDVFFGLAIFVCCTVMIFALLVFIWSCIDLSDVTNRLISDYQRYVSTMKGDINTNGVYLEKLIDYAAKLQELEAKSTSSNIITFIYTFLSGALIGVATYFAKKSEESVKQIQENKELIINLDSRTLFSNFYMYVQRTYSTIQIFDLSLEAIQNREVLEEFVNNNITKLNNVINEMDIFTKKNEAGIPMLTQSDKACIVDEMNKIGMIIVNMRVLGNDDPVADIYNESTKMRWKKQIDEVRNVLRK